ncbi:hypothetical protein KLF44_04475 [Clostridium perfringens]|uniref:hypothetical protein n=1 Tax=Clostridium perfringens TaxID=1502 RepID=UPI001CCDCEB4|nr:hypothetical protein [Clostridium perfringens]UBK38674.1 hypothetical protein KLF44_04475 [Clostridium perfringens]UBK95510.1 hypothetical protein KLF49_04470 [Clostridium perfringens]
MEEKDKKKIKELVEWWSSLPITNGMEEDYFWNPLIKLLSKNLDDTITFLNECSDKEINYISEVFPDLSENFESKKFIDKLREIQNKRPDLDINEEIKAAEYVIES